MTAKPAGKASERGKASEAIPVLIRLPRLVAEPEPYAASSVAEDEPGIRATIPLQARAADLEPSLPVPDDARKINDATTADIPPGTVFQMPSLAPRPAPRVTFRCPRWAIQAGIALGLIAVLMLAFSAIRGPSKPADKVADFASADTWPMPSIPGSEMKPLPLSIPPLPAPAPASPMAAAPDASAAAPNGLGNTAPENTVPGIANEAKASSEMTPASPAVPFRGDSRYAPLAAESQAPPASLPGSSASKMDAAPAAQAPAVPAAELSPAKTELNAAEQANTEANLPLTNRPAGPEPSTTAGRESYPETDPTTFQYPVDYHLRLLSQPRAPAREIDETGAGAPNFNGPLAGGAAANGWQPNTARLQPRIEPPPAR